MGVKLWRKLVGYINVAIELHIELLVTVRGLTRRIDSGTVSRNLEPCQMTITALVTHGFNVRHFLLFLTFLSLAMHQRATLNYALLRILALTRVRNGFATLFGETRNTIEK